MDTIIILVAGAILNGVAAIGNLNLVIKNKFVDRKTFLWVGCTNAVICIMCIILAIAL